MGTFQIFALEDNKNLKKSPLNSTDDKYNKVDLKTCYHLLQ